jgi:hypothetical protein
MHESLSPSQIELINRDAERCRDLLNARPRKVSLFSCSGQG